ncbi:MAG: hypothetical protein K2N60_05170 [Oscillospiraceae bacterium]|nr:hypothetical protein [Oscillospiraceae bacterium]
MEKFKKDLAAKTFLTFAAVIFLDAVYWIFSAFKESASGFTRGFGGGLSLALLGYGVFQAFRLYMLKIDEKKLEELYRKSKDERYALIREKTASGSFAATTYIVCLGAIISSFFSQEITIVLAGVITVMAICTLCFKFYYERKY